MSKSRPLADLLLEDCTIAPLEISTNPAGNLTCKTLQLENLCSQSLSHWELAHYAAVESWLLDYQPNPDMVGLDWVRGHLEAIEHLVELEDGQRIEQLFLAEYPIDNCQISVCDFLHDRGYFAELAEVGDRLCDYISEKVKVKVWLKMGNAKRAFGYYSEAKVYFSKIINSDSDSFQQFNVNYKILGNAYHGMGNCFQAEGDLKKAEAYFMQQLDLGKNYQDDLQLARAEVGLARTLQDSGDYRQSLDYLKSGYEKIKNSNEHLFKLDTINLLGCHYMRTGDTQKAEETFNQLLNLAQEYRSIHYEWVAIANLGSNFIVAHNYQLGINYHKKALSISLNRHDPLGIEISSDVMGNCYLRLKEFPKAIKLLQETLRNTYVTGNLYQKSTVLANLSYGYARMRHPRKELAFRTAKRALRIARKINNKKQQSIGLATLANAYWCYGQRFTGVIVYLKSLWVRPPWIDDDARYAFLIFLETVFPFFFKLKHRKQ